MAVRFPLHSHADPSRRAWLPCPNCGWGRDKCSECRSRRNCGAHWQYLLSNQATRVNLQRPGCANLWSVDTRNR